MKRNPFVIPFILISLFIIFASVMPTYASTNDYTLVKSYCKKHYPKHQIVVFTKYNPNVMENRKNKRVIYVEKFVSYSKGKYGYSKKGEYVKYNKRVKKGKKVISYFVYNPYTNYCDDVVIVVDNGKIR